MKAKLLFSALFVYGGVLAQFIEPKYEVFEDVVKVTYYHENGTISQEGYYKNGKLHGQWVSFTKNGKQLASGQYNMGQKEGKWTFNNNEKISQVEYTNGQINKVN